MARGTITVGPPETSTAEVRHGRNFIRRGDMVRVSPSRPGKHDGFVARFVYADEDRGGTYFMLQEVTTVKGGRVIPCGFRTLKPERVRRLRRKA